MPSLLLLLAVFVPGILSQDTSKYCPTGSTYEDRCLAMNYPSAFLRDTDECIIVIEDRNARQNQVDSACSGLGKLSGFEGTPFRKQSNDQIKEIESFFALKQGGGHYFGYDQINPTSKNGNGAEGYVCSFKDKCHCDRLWKRYKDHCYRPVKNLRSHQRAAQECEDFEGKLVQIKDDEENKFVALMAQREFFSNSNSKAVFWGSLAVVDNEWKHFKSPNEAYDDKIKYMRWWADSNGIEPVKKPKNKGQTIYAGNSDEKQNNKFGYWGTADQEEKYPFICFAKLLK